MRFHEIAVCVFIVVNQALMPSEPWPGPVEKAACGSIRPGL